MNKIKFLKNNKEIEFDVKEVHFDKIKKIIKKENSTHIIVLDFVNKKCEMFLKTEQLWLEIPVIFMDYKQASNDDILIYTLASEPEVINTILVSKK